jgi:hypothetical protein
LAADGRPLFGKGSHAGHVPMAGPENETPLVIETMIHDLARG